MLAASSRDTLSGLRKARRSSIKNLKNTQQRCYLKRRNEPTYSWKVQYPAVPNLVLETALLAPISPTNSQAYHPKTPSPFLSLVTPSPTSTTTPDASQPMTMGHERMRTPPICMSVSLARGQWERLWGAKLREPYTGLIPAYRDFTRTCFGPGVGFSMSDTSS
jgi:hypothetical protein